MSVRLHHRAGSGAGRPATGLRIERPPARGRWPASACLDNAFRVTEEDEGRIYVPHRLGIERAGRAKPFPGSEQWRTYDDLSMAMCGLVKQGSALLVNWDCVDTRLSVHSDWPDLPLVPGRRACDIAPGDRIAARGLHDPSAWARATMSRSPRPTGPWPKPRAGCKHGARSARTTRPWTGCSARWTSSRSCSPGSCPVRCSAATRRSTSTWDYTFDEVAQCAEHWRNDLGIDRAFGGPGRMDPSRLRRRPSRRPARRSGMRRQRGPGPGRPADQGLRVSRSGCTTTTRTCTRTPRPGASSGSTRTRRAWPGWAATGTAARRGRSARSSRWSWPHGRRRTCRRSPSSSARRSTSSTRSLPGGWSPAKTRPIR